MKHRIEHDLVGGLSPIQLNKHARPSSGSFSPSIRVKSQQEFLSFHQRGWWFKSFHPTIKSCLVALRMLTQIVYETIRNW